MNPVHVEAVKNIKNAVVNKAFLHSKKLTCVSQLLYYDDWNPGHYCYPLV